MMERDRLERSGPSLSLSTTFACVRKFCMKEREGEVKRGRVGEG